MNKKISLFLLIFFAFIDVYSQVNLSTGAAQINIPLFNIQDTKSGLGCSVNLKYIDGNGINVDEIASNVGTGWILDAGGVITRTVLGEPDDQKYPGTLPSDDASYVSAGYPYYFANGYMYSSYSPADPVPGFAAQHLLYPANTQSYSKPALKTTADRQQDIFTFSFNGRSGSFYIGNDKSIMQVINSKLKISFTEQDMSSQGIRTRINQFTITDENGTIYTFSELELSTIMNYYADGSTGTNGYTIYDGNHFNGGDLNPPYLPQIVTKWYLTSVKNPFTTDQVSFTYSAINVDIKGTRHLLKQTGPPPPGNVGDVTTYSMNRERYQYTGKRLTRIDAPNNQSLIFLYNNLARADLPGDNALNSITLVSNYLGTDKTEYYYQFDEGYFFQNQVVPYNYTFASNQISLSRLCLQSFQKFSGDNSLNLPPTTFTYNLSIPNHNSIVPAQFSLNKDLWGYYSLSVGGGSAANYNDNVTVFPFYQDNYDNIDPQFVFASIGLINKVTYSTGGSLSFIYEQNQASESNIWNNLAPGVRVSTLNLDDGFGNVKQLQYSYVKADGTTSGRGFELPSVSSTANIRVYKVPSGYHSSSNVTDIFTTALNSYISATTSFHSSFNAGSFAVNLVIAIILNQLVQDLIYVFSPPYQDQSISISFFDNQNLVNVFPIQYSRVEVAETSNSSKNGKTVYELTSFDDYPPLVASFNNIPNSNSPLFTSQQRTAFWQYGLQKKIQYYDNSINPVHPIKEIINNYTPYVTTFTNPAFLSTVWAENTTVYTPYDYSPYDLSNSYVTSTSYYPVSGRMELTSTVENTYDKNANVFQKTTNYYYNSTNYQVNRTETFNNSNSGEIFGKSIYYPSDYDPTVNLSSALTNKNIYSVPVTVAEWKKYGVTGTPILTGATVNKFTTAPNGEVKVGTLYGFEHASPVSGSFVSNFSSATAPYSYSYLAPKKVLSYDNSGALTAITENGQTEGFITSYTGRYTIAKAFNCKYKDIAFTGFEDNNNGNWNYNNGNSITSSAKTGNYSFKLATSPNMSVTTHQTLTSGKTYIVSLWLKTGSGSCTVNGAAINQILNNADGWTYCTLNVSGVTSITIGGTGTIDELRLYPIGSEMTSYSYDLMKGVTSQADANSRISYNQYDALGRPDLILDQNKNIIKKFSYNYAGQQTNYAGTVFYNSTMIGYFKATCSGCNISDPVPYTVQANTYYSLISPDDVYQKAMADINANGQNYANAHPACRVPQNISVTYNNATSYYGHIQLTNKCSGTVYTFDLISNKPNGTVAGTIPQGIYDVYMYSSGTGNYSYRVYDYMQSGVPTMTVTNIDFSNANITTESLSLTN